MRKKRNLSASEITHMLAEAGGGAKSKGGKGMQGGLDAIAKRAAENAIDELMKPRRRSTGIHDNIIHLKKNA